MSKNFFDSNIYNAPIFETEHFVVIPTLGAMIEGWMLIVPKKFYLSFSQMPQFYLDEVESICLKLDDLYLKFFNAGKSILFEHGPSKMNSVVGCGVDYAHLHWVPTNFDMIFGLEKFLKLKFDWKEISTFNLLNSRVDESKDYLYLKDQNCKHYLTNQFNIPSQTFRKVIAYYLGVPDLFDWKSNMNMENIHSLYSKLNFGGLNV